MTRAVSILLFFALAAQGVEYNLPTSRLPGGVRWTRSSAGVEGGIPNSALMPVYITLSSTVTVAQANAHIAACPSNQVVDFLDGNYSFTGRILMKSGVVARGESTNTIWSFTGGGGFVNGLVAFMGPFVDPPSVIKTWSSGLSQGSTTLTLNNVTSLAVGDLIAVDRLNDTSDAYGVSNVDTSGLRATGQRGQGQYSRITAINGNDVTLSHPILADNYSGGTPELFRVGAPMVMAGLENLTIINADQDNADYNIYLQGVWNCWIKNVYGLGAERSHSRIYQGGRVEVRHSWFERTEEYASQSYGINLTYASFCLIEDNIFYEVTSPVNLWGACTSGNVIAYNFTQFGRYEQSIAWLAENMFTHGMHPTHNLWEGNFITCLYYDYIHGSASHNTAFRNRITGWEPEYLTGHIKTGNTYPIVAERNNRSMSWVGNVLGQDGYHTGYMLTNQSSSAHENKSIYKLGYKGSDLSTLNWDLQTMLEAIIRGNFNYVDDAVPSNESLGSDTLADSWFHSSKPTWFGDRPWPWVEPSNPSQAVATNLPAGYRFTFGVDPPEEGESESDNAVSAVTGTGGRSPVRALNF